MALKKPERLAGKGLQTERLMWPGKGPSTFEQEVDELEQKLMLTTVDKAVA